MLNPAQIGLDYKEYIGSGSDISMTANANYDLGGTSGVLSLSEGIWLVEYKGMIYDANDDAKFNYVKDANNNTLSYIRQMTKQLSQPTTTILKITEPTDIHLRVVSNTASKCGQSASYMKALKLA